MTAGQSTGAFSLVRYLLLLPTLLPLMAGGVLSEAAPSQGPAMGHVSEAGSGDRDVILMPCLGCDWRSWDQFMERNAGRYHMLAVTWPGMGDTPLPAVEPRPRGTPYFDYLTGALERLIADHSLDRPVLVGHSAAAVLAVRFASEHPDLLGGIVNVDAILANGDTYGFDGEKRLRWADDEMQDVLEQYDSDAAWRELNRGPADMGEARAAFYERMWLTPPRQSVFDYWRDWLRTDAGALLPGLRVPFLAVHALSPDKEKAASKKADLEARYARAPLPPGAKVVYIENSGHTIWEYQPEAFDAALADFILAQGGASQPGSEAGNAGTPPPGRAEEDPGPRVR